MVALSLRRNDFLLYLESRRELVTGKWTVEVNLDSVFCVFILRGDVGVLFFFCESKYID